MILELNKLNERDFNRLGEFSTLVPNLLIGNEIQSNSRSRKDEKQVQDT